MGGVLVTGFAPFAGSPVNASWEAVQAAALAWTDDVPLHIAELPVTYGGAAERLAALVDEHRPSVVVATGVAVGRAQVTPERIGINLRDSAATDNAGTIASDQEIEPGGPAARWSTLPVSQIVAALTAAEIPAAASLSAGSYVCNEVLYSLGGIAARAGIRHFGFLHLPATPSMAPAAGTPTLPVDTLARAITIALHVTLATDGD